MADVKKDIQTAGPECFDWNSADPAKSLQDLRTYVEGEAQKAINWYWREKNGKKTPSQVIQFMALVLTAGAGLVPIVLQALKNAGVKRLEGFDSGPIASLLVGLAAALLGLDKAFGYSSGWTRYILTATSMTKQLHEFRMEWVALSAASAAPPNAEQVASLIQKARDFVSGVQAALLQETKDWATEFQSNAAQMEKDLKNQFDALKTQVDQVAKEREQASRPSALELTVANADKTDGFTFDVVLEGKSGKFSESVANSKIWTQIDRAPGQYRLNVTAKAKGIPVGTSAIIELKPAETNKASITLPIA